MVVVVVVVRGGRGVMGGVGSCSGSDWGPKGVQDEREEEEREAEGEEEENDEEEEANEEEE